jgi:hypothetical protein
LAPPHIGNSENRALRREHRAKGDSTTERSWLDALKSLEEKATAEGKRRTDAALPSVEDISEAPVQRAAKSPTPSPDGDRSSNVNITEAKPKEAQCTLVTTQDQLPAVIADLKDVNIVALDLGTTGLDPRMDSIRLLSLATKGATHIVDCRSVDPTGLFPILAEVTVVAHNTLFDLVFLSSLGFVPGKVADTMILSQLLYAGSKVEPLKRGHTSHSLDSVVKRELRVSSTRPTRAVTGAAPSHPR